MNIADAFEKVKFNLEVIFLNFDQIESSCDSFLSNLSSIFDNVSVKSCRIIHPSGVEYHFTGNSKDIDSKKVIPVLGNCVDPVIWKGYVELKRHNLRKHWASLVRRLCFLRSRKPSYCAIWRFVKGFSFFQLIELERRNIFLLDEPSFPSTIYSFSLGNIINGNRYVIHFGSFWNEPPILNYSQDNEIPIENIKIKHDHNKKKFVLKFNLKITTKKANVPALKKYRLVYDYKSIKRVLICSSRVDQMRLYIQLLYPPRIFKKEPDRKSDNLKRIRRKSCGKKLSRHVIGNSDVLRLVIHTEDDSIINAIYKWQKYHYFDICYGSVIEFHMNPIKPKYSSTFPFQVNYALNCIHSIGYHFLNDLKKNHGGLEVINEIILEYINANKEELIVEVLYRLFDAYLAGKVYNAIGHFKLLLSQTESEWMDETNNQKTKDKTNYRSWATLIPTRTILTPPIAYDSTEYMTDHLIRAIVRDEDIDLAILLDRNVYNNLDDLIPYRERSSENDQFLNSVIEIGRKKSPSFKCFRVAGYSYDLPKTNEFFPTKFKDGHQILIKSD